MFVRDRLQIFVSNSCREFVALYDFMRYSISRIRINSYHHLLEFVCDSYVIRMQFVSNSYKQFLNTINSYQNHISNSYKQFVSNSYHNSYRNQTIRKQFLTLVRLYELNPMTPFTHMIEFVSIRIKLKR